MLLRPFQPLTAGTITVSATSTNSSTSLGGALATAAGSIRAANAGPSIAFIVFGVGAQTAVTTTSTPVLPGTVEVFGKGASDTVGIICATSQTATVYLTPGEGE